MATEDSKEPKLRLLKTTLPPSKPEPDPIPSQLPLASEVDKQTKPTPDWSDKRSSGEK